VVQIEEPAGRLLDRWAGKIKPLSARDARCAKDLLCGDRGRLSKNMASDALSAWFLPAFSITMPASRPNGRVITARFFWSIVF